VFSRSTGSETQCLAASVDQTCSNGTLSPSSGVFQSCSETKTGYLAATVPFGSTCQQSTATRSCTGTTCGAWSQNLVSSCTVASPSACGATPHGQTNKVFTRSTGSESQCLAASVDQTCSNGTLSPSSGVFQSCSETKTGYLAATVPFGSTCQQSTATRSCTGTTCGAWSINLSASCSVQAPLSCSGVSHGQSRIMYNVSSAGPNGCFAQTQTCNNGVFSPSSSSQTSCRETQTMYTTSLAPAGSSCSSYVTSVQRTCQNGSCSSWPGGYFSSCSVQQCTQLSSYNFWQPSGLVGTQCGCTTPSQKGQNHPDHPRYLNCRQGSSPTNYTWQVINSTTGSIYMQQCGNSNPSQRGARHPTYSDMYCGPGQNGGYVWRYY
jgi:hypothetical protein